MNNLDKQYTDLLQDILDNGVVKGDRTGTGTVSVFSRQIRHKMSEGFPLLTTKKMPWKVIVTELIWFLKGDTNIQYLVKNGCNIWNGDAYKKYCKDNIDKLKKYKESHPNRRIKWGRLSLEEFVDKIKTDDEFAKKWGELGPIYGAQWRHWGTDETISVKTGERYPSGEFKYNFLKKGVDQIANLIHDLKNNPDSRRLMVNAWNVGEISHMTLPPCHYGFQCYTRELSLGERIAISNATDEGKVKMINDLGRFIDAGPAIETLLDDENVPKRELSLSWNQRSVDTFLGLPFNIASYGLLLEILAKEVNMIPGELIGNLGDTHLYSNHLEQAKEQSRKRLTIEERRVLAKEIGCDISGRGGMTDIIEHSLYNLKGIIKNNREPYPLTTLKFMDHLADFDSIIDIIRPKDFILDNYQSHPAIKAPLSN